MGNELLLIFHSPADSQFAILHSQRRRWLHLKLKFHFNFHIIYRTGNLNHDIKYKYHNAEWSIFNYLLFIFLLNLFLSITGKNFFFLLLNKCDLRTIDTKGPSNPDDSSPATKRVFHARSQWVCAFCFLPHFWVVIRELFSAHTFYFGRRACFGLCRLFVRSHG